MASELEVGKIGVGAAPSTYQLDVTTTGNNGIRTSNGTATVYMGSTSGAAAIGTLNDNSLNVITNGGTRLSISSAGNVDIADGDLSVNGEATIKRFASYRNLTLQRAQGTSASPTTIANGQTLGKLSFKGYTGSVYREGAAIAGKVSAGVSGDEIPSSLIFYTAADGATSATERLSISSAGLATFSNGIAVTTGGVKFPATQSASADANTLDDYEEGTWTPNLLLGGSNTGITFSIRSGTYTKTGNVVNYWFSLGLTSKGSQTGSITIDDLPFLNQAAGTGAGNFNYVNNVAGTNWEKSFHLTQGGSDDLLYARYINGTNFAALADTDITDTTIMYGGGSYITTA